MNQASEWLKRYSRQAMEQGWDLFTTHGGEQDGELQIQVIQDPEGALLDPPLPYTEPKFQGQDHLAAEFVEQQAYEGSELAQAAIRELITYGAPDVSRFKLLRRLKEWKRKTKAWLKFPVQA